MRSPSCCAALLLLAACGDASPALSGTLLPNTRATAVWVVGGPEQAPIEGDSFRIAGLAGDTLDLRFARDGEEVASMVLVGGAGEEVRLEGIWFRDGRAFPTRLGGEAPALQINGIRYVGVDAMPETVDAKGVVLAIDGAAEAMLLRPADAGLPDLRVVVTPGTRVRSPDGEPAELEEVQYQDTLRVSGQSLGAYLVATEIVVPRRLAGGDVGRGRG